MTISVKDIQEKEFSTVSGDGYSMEQVDDFLDELAEQWGSLLRENLALGGQVKQLQADLEEAKAANAEMEKRLPDYNEKSYFENLRSAMREALIGAQRIADEAVSEAQRQAKQTIEDANARAEKTVADADAHAKEVTEHAEQTVSDLNAEAERLRASVADYKGRFKQLIDEHLATLNLGEGK